LIAASPQAKIVIDPGEFTEIPTIITDVAAVIVTHKHGDHLSLSNLESIRDSNPNFILYGPQDVIDACANIAVRKQVIATDTVVQVADMNVTLYAADHDVIYQVSPCKTLAIKIDDQLYYPGDSFRVISDHVWAVAVPISAPWLKSSESIAFAQAINADIAFPTHDGLLNDIGLNVTNTWLEKGLDGTNTAYKLVKPGEQV
ncbi:MAG: MBL fold metallo-hydrolase, partial [Candidatus Saccharibacteria bacterium]